MSTKNEVAEAKVRSNPAATLLALDWIPAKIEERKKVTLMTSLRPDTYEVKNL